MYNRGFERYAGCEVYFTYGSTVHSAPTGQKYVVIYINTRLLPEIAVGQWLKCCATYRKVAGSIPDGVIGIFIHIKSFRSHYGTGIDSASNRNEYQEYFLGVKSAGA